MKRIALLILLVFFVHIPAAYAHTLMVPEKTEVILKLLTPLKSGKTPVGEVVEFLVEKPIRSKEGTVLIEDAASAYGTVIVSKKVAYLELQESWTLKLTLLKLLMGFRFPFGRPFHKLPPGAKGPL